MFEYVKSLTHQNSTGSWVAYSCGGEESVNKAGRAVARKQRYANHSFLACRSPDPSVLGAAMSNAEAKDFRVTLGVIIARSPQVSPSPAKIPN